VFDTGGGEATLVRTATHALLYDNGEVWGSRGQVSAARLLPALRHYHVASLDRLLLPRLDTDRGAGVTALRAALPVTGLAAGGGRQLPPEIVPCTSGERWRWDAVEFEVLAGPACSLRVAVPGTAAALLLPGSADAAAQTHSIAPGLAATAVVLVPGHGSAVARSAALMAASGAQWAILSATARAACRSGVSATLAAWRSTGAQTWVTGQQGALELDFLTTGAITVTGWRKPQSGQRRSVSCAVGKNVELTSRCGKSCVPADG
jgi:competence protein ComEC